MKNKFKYLMTSICILGILFGRILNSELTRYFGNDASNIVIAICVTVVLCAILLSIVMRQFIAAIGLLCMTTPLIIGGIGLFLDNLVLVILGILSLFIVTPVLIIVIKRFRHD